MLENRKKAEICNIKHEVFIKNAILCLSMFVSVLVSLLWEDNKGGEGGVWITPQNDDVIYEQPLNGINLHCHLTSLSIMVIGVLWSERPQMSNILYDSALTKWTRWIALFQCQLVRPICKTWLILHFFMICTIQHACSKPLMPINNSTTDHSRLHKCLLSNISHHTNFIFSVSLSYYTKV